ncbi:MAG: class I SAM-dependent methyltransferase [Deltaproteobacteria bacterium]|nr:class I SAM-dependent methyltransferase [Deltaproteobacteria bacterium]
MTNIEAAKQTLGEEFAMFCELLCQRIEAIKLPAGARVLDVGTGMGRAAITLALCGFDVTTGEPADDQSAYARQPWMDDARRVGVDRAIQFRAFDASALPFEDGSFDALFMLGALHHMRDPQAVIDECIRVVRTAGALCILEPTAQLVEHVRARHPDHPEPTDPRPLVPSMQVEHIGGEMMDTFIIRR